MVFITISVTDFGAGMEPSIAKRIFKVHVNNPGTGTAKEKGSDIGLSICRELAEKLEGMIWAESRLGKRSVFYISLPVY